jgi:hypothetical protein
MDKFKVGQKMFEKNEGNLGYLVIFSEWSPVPIKKDQSDFSIWHLFVSLLIGLLSCGGIVTLLAYGYTAEDCIIALFLAVCASFAVLMFGALCEACS